MTAVVMMVVVAARRKGGNRVEELGGFSVVEKYNFSSSIAVSVITACHA